MDYHDRILKCVECGEEFVFTAGEQMFFADKGFKNEPKRCRTCKAKRAEGGVTASPMRSETKMNCSQCGKETTVPFRPSQGRPVYCRECFTQRRQTASSVPACDAAPAETTVVCSKCGNQVTMQVQPPQGQPVYCPKCLQLHQTAAVSSAPDDVAERPIVSAEDRPKPPRVAELLLYLFLPRNDLLTIPGDIEEVYWTTALPKLGPHWSRLWYFKEVLRTLFTWNRLKVLVVLSLGELYRRLKRF